VIASLLKAAAPRSPCYERDNSDPPISPYRSGVPAPGVLGGAPWLVVNLGARPRPPVVYVQFNILTVLNAFSYACVTRLLAAGGPSSRIDRVSRRSDLDRSLRDHPCVQHGPVPIVRA